MPVSLPALSYPGFCDGLDLSAVQRIDDADAVRRAGFRFAFCKASEGLRGRDPAYQRHADALRGAGLHVGAYGFAHVSQGQPRAQARHLYDTATADGRIVAPGLEQFAAANTAAIVALHNAWPSVSARLRAVEAEVERLRALSAEARDMLRDMPWRRGGDALVARLDRAALGEP